jgi:hypothetical protein
MRVSLHLSLGVAAVILLLAPASSSAGVPGQGSWPAGNFARASTSTDCTGPIQAPVEMALVGFDSAAQAKATIRDETDPNGWFDLDPGDDLLSMKDGPAVGAAVQCVGETIGRLSPQTSDGQFRTHMSLWNNATSAVVAGAPVRQKKTTSACGATPGSPRWITTSDGYRQGLQSFEAAFTGSPATVGPYPVQSVNWGNSTSIQQCYGTTVAGDGYVDVIRPKDDFGFHETFTQTRDDLLRTGPASGGHQVGTCDQTLDETVAPIKNSVIEQMQGAGVTTVRFGLRWDTVAPCAASTPGQWWWERWDKTIPKLSNAGIKPIVEVLGAPENQSGQPPWSKPGCPGVVNTTDSDALANWRAFVKKVALNYAGQIKAIEVWNEENTSLGWSGCQPNPEDYAAILHSALLGVADSNTNVKVIVGAPFSNEFDSGSDIGWRNYLTRFFGTLSSNDEASLDGVGFHPYRTPADRGGGVQPADSAKEQIQLFLGKLRELSVDSPVWVTEVGTTTVDGDNTGWYVGPDAAVQGADDVAIYDTIRNLGVPTTIVYAYTDNNSSPPSTGAGVLKPPVPETSTAPFPTKPAYCLLAAERGETLPNPCPSE